MATPTPKRHPNALPVGARLREYQIEEVLGVGGFGITYKAKHENFSNKYVAVKEYLPVSHAYRDSDSRVQLLESGDQSIFDWGLERFFEEANNLHRLDHPSIVHVENVFKENDTAYMVMDVVRGVSTHQLIVDGEKLSEHQLWSLFDQLTDALRVVHEAGFIHRDITPANIIFRPNAERAVLIDFGSSKAQLGQTELLSGGDHTRIFTPGYAPLEQHEGTPQDQRSDIYGLAASLYHLALQVQPRPAAERAGALRTTGNDPLTSAVELGEDSYSSELLNTIERGLALYPEDRPETVAEWVAQARGGDGMTVAAPISKRRRAQATKRRSASAKPRLTPVTLAGAGVAALLLVLGGLHFSKVIDLPGLTGPGRVIARGVDELQAAPMSAAAAARAAQYFSEAQLLDGPGATLRRARAGEDLTEALGAFQDAIVDLDLGFARDRLAEVLMLADRTELNDEFDATVKGVFDFETQLRAFLAGAEQTRLAEAELEALQELQTGLVAPDLPDAAERRGAAQQVVEILASARAALEQTEFDNAQALLGQAIAAADPIGYEKLQLAAARDAVSAARRSYLDDALVASRDQTLADPTNLNALSATIARLEQAIGVDPESPELATWLELTQGLASSRSAMNADEGAESERRASALADVEALRSVAPNAGVADAQWDAVVLEYENLATIQQLDQAIGALAVDPIDDSRMDGLALALANARQFSAANTPSERLTGLTSAAQQLVDYLSIQRGLVSEHRYIEAIADVGALPADALPAAEALQAGLQTSIENRQSAEIEVRRANLRNAMMDRTLGQPSSAARSASEQLATLALDDVLLARASTRLSEMEGLEALVASDDFSSAKAVIAQLSDENSEIAKSLGLPAEHHLANQQWLQQRATEFTNRHLQQLFAAASPDPLSLPAFAAVEEGLTTAAQALGAASVSTENVASLQGQLDVLRGIAEQASLGKFSDAASGAAALRDSLADNALADAGWLNAIDAALQRNQQNFTGELDRTISSGLDRTYQQLAAAPLAAESIGVAKQELAAAENIMASLEPGLYDWSATEEASQITVTLEQARAQIDSDADFLGATRRIIDQSMNLAADSRWRSVLETARATIQTDMNGRISQLLDEAGGLLAEQALAPAAQNEAKAKFEQAIAIQGTSEGIAGKGLQLVATLAAASGAIESADTAQLAALQQRDLAPEFAEVPEASRAVELMLAGARDVLISESAAAEFDAAELLTAATAGSADGLEVGPLLAALEERALLAKERRLTIATSLEESKALVGSLLEVESLIDNLRFNAAFDALSAAPFAAARESLPDALWQPLDTLRARQSDRIAAVRTRRMVEFTDWLVAAVADVRQQPFAASTNESAATKVNAVLELHADHGDALAMQALLQELAKIDPADQTSARCDSWREASARRAAIGLPLIDWQWLDNLESELCP